MFLRVLQSNTHKALFMQLARVVAIAEGDIDAFRKSIVWGEVDGKLPALYEMFVKAMTSREEEDRARMHAFELGFQDGDKMDIGAFDRNFCIVSTFVSAFDAVLEEMKGDPDLKKRVVSELVENGVELTAITQDTVKAQLLFVESVRRAVLVAVVRSLLTQKGVPSTPRILPLSGGWFAAIAAIGNVASVLAADGGLNVEELDLSLQQRRTIVFELIGMGQADGDVGSDEQFVIELVSDLLGIERAFLDEARGVVKAMNAAVKDALEIITE